MNARMRWGAAGSALAIMMMLGGCGGPSEDQIAQAKREGAAEASKAAEVAKEKADQKKMAADVAAAAKAAADAAKAATSTRTVVVNGGGGGTGSGYCGNNVSVNSSTSCAFAMNVASDWRRNGGGSASFSSYSPVTGRTYWMSCSGGYPAVCRGGNNAVVYIR